MRLPEREVRAGRVGAHRHGDADAVRARQHTTILLYNKIVVSLHRYQGLDSI